MARSRVSTSSSTIRILDRSWKEEIFPLSVSTPSLGHAKELPPASSRDSSPAGSRGLRILLIEDDEADAHLIKEALLTNPRVKEVVIATDGVRALQLIEAGTVRPDLAFVDLHMPRKDGLALLDNIAQKKGARFPSVVLTSSRTKTDEQRSRAHGAMGFVTKPISQAKLRQSLDRLIARV